MPEDPFLTHLKQEILRLRTLSFEEFIKPLVDRGIVDEEGRVLVRMPEPPRWDRPPVAATPKQRPRKKKRPAPGGDPA